MSMSVLIYISIISGALEGDVGSPVEPKSEAVADMEISDNEEATKPPLPPMPHPDDEPALKQSNWEIGELFFIFDNLLP